ncbi:uncharacterized protein LOC121985465 isoform X2 [Zingiber officinale]|uniref:uncharacterized protein LOC121985465 isoform X2 n=1 Tax=Zingiber officinale TaxID=94328 RepID=UPI001C4B8BF0|nr:uncharacterized protein LOC121985465 isoform X2 [Zingiber officinale]
MEASAAPATSPSSDERLWAGLRDRVDSILQNRDPKIQLSISSCCKMESECGKRLREGSELLMRGFDSVSSSLTHLSSTLNSTRQRVIDLTKYSAPDVLHEESNNADEEVPKPKRHCVSEETRNKDEVGSCDEHDSPVTKTSTESDKVADSSKGDEKIAVAASPSEVLKKNKTLAVMMATKASYLSRELKGIKSEFGFMQERCNLLEEENRRLHDVIDKGETSTGSSVG